MRYRVDRDEIANKLAELAMDGDVQALKYIYDMIDGSPTQTVNQTIMNLPKVVEVDVTDSKDSSDNGDAPALEEHKALPDSQGG